MYKSTDIAKFVRAHLKKALPDFTGQYKKRDIFRMRGPIVQWVFVGVSRGGWIEVSPALSVLGTTIHEKDMDSYRCKDGSIDLNALIRSVSALKSTSPSALRRWNFSPETPLDDALADEILARLKQDSTISFIESLSDEGFEKALRMVGKDKLHWASDFFLAFFNMTRGAASARSDLARAFKLFIKHSRYSTAKPPFDFEEALYARFKDLESRLDRPDCIASCRADAEEHAKLLKLPSIVWPSDWPLSVPPWPKQESTGFITQIGTLFRR